MNIQWVGANANNFEKGRSGNTVKKVVIHWIVGRLAAADATFQDPNRVASAHYGIGNTVVHQYVNEEDTAYHAGNLTVNRQSIGIEHEGGPDIPISEATYKTSSQLVADICRRYAIPVDRAHIIKHSEVKATQCPGTLDIDKLIGMVKQIVAPAPDVDVQTELDKVREERDRNWRWFTGLCDILQVQPNFDVASQELKKLVTFEDMVSQKDRQLEDANKKIADLQTDLKTLQEAHSKTTESNELLIKKANEQAETIEDQGNKINNLSKEIDELRKNAGLPVLTGWKKILYELLIK